MSPTISPFASVKDQSLIITSGLVAGEWLFPGKTFEVIEPSSATELIACADLGREEMLQAIDSAEIGTREFAEGTTAKQRGDILRRWYELVKAKSDDLAIILSLENGKTLAEAKGEITLAANTIAWFAEEATRSYGDTIPSSFPNTTVLTVKEPVGVCGIITPWNFPAAMITRKIAPAFAVGCSVVIKPPSETPLSALALAKLALEAGIPHNCLHVVPTRDRTVAMELATNPKVKKLSFTGSTGVGKILAKAAADSVKRLSLELGGNAPFIVFEDADVDLAVEGAMVSKFRCSGQTCVCANRILVHESVQDDFIAKLKKRVGTLKLGRGIDQGTTQGPLVNSAAVKKVDAHVKDALSKGATLQCGGKAPSHLAGFFYEPTIISGATSQMEVAVDETFGPLAAIFSFQTEEQAVEMANATEYGLAGYFFSRDVGRVLRVSKKLQTGMIGVNTGLFTAVETPFGGIKESGMGRENSKYGLHEYQNIKAITIGNTQA